jgi:hypothetical protein
MTIDDQQRMDDRLIELLQQMNWLPKNQQLAMLYGMIGAIAALADDDLWAMVIDAASLTLVTKGHRSQFGTPPASARA